LLGQKFRRAARRQDLDFESGETARKLGKAALIGYADQRRPDGNHRLHLYFERLDFLSQGIAVDPEHLRGDGLISLGPVEQSSSIGRSTFLSTMS